MTSKAWRFALLLALSPLAALVVGGCNKESPKTEAPKRKPIQVAEKSDKEGHDHGGWWCDEHGVPEEVCGQCNAKVVAQFKKQGDWCKEHDRPDSQCFVCHPELKERFAAQHRAKYGKEPPPTDDEKDTKEGKK
jgi:hypothetical protein